MERLKVLKDDMQGLIKDIQDTVPYAPVEGCELFMKRLYDAISEHLEAVSEAIEHWEWTANKEG
ncbi:hypothetical protein [Hydrogenobacter thermophilus]|uniref:hypothetical protein n=1 Tax=Hydrogenobacter thermophilus TaxID=940 RepID=UPI003CCCCCA6